MGSGVSKAIIHIEAESGLRSQLHSLLRYLMSSKRKPGHRDHSRLEFLGGRHDPGEIAITALLRELAEEELTGKLSVLAESRVGECFEINHDKTHHYLYQFSLVESECTQLVPDPGESLGFTLVPASQLVPGEQFTFKTNQILRSLLKSDPAHLLADRHS